VRDTCASNGWPLLEYKADECLPTPQIYEDIICEHGMPGPQQHQKMYARLKERPIRQLIREHKKNPHDRIMLITGVRSLESDRRMGHVKEIQVDGIRLWVAPIMHWGHDDIHRHIEANELPRNPVKLNLCISGECLCGCFAHEGERAEIAHFYPEADAELTRLEQKAAACGVWSKWGKKPPQTYVNERNGQTAMPLCSSCQFYASLEAA
jgi:3'-phosphoadenosine 5'-phosphosulfate sulfotransferase (PAPS reductase)/FAD synthetase